MIIQRLHLLTLAAVVSITAPAVSATPAVPAGAAVSLEALRLAYLAAVRARKPEAIAAMFDMTSFSPADRVGFTQEAIADKIKAGVVQATIVDFDDHYKALFSGAHFTQPVVKLLKINLSVPKGQELSTTYGIAVQAGRYFFVPMR